MAPSEDWGPYEEPVRLMWQRRGTLPQLWTCTLFLAAGIGSDWLPTFRLAQRAAGLPCQHQALPV